MPDNGRKQTFSKQVSITPAHNKIRKYGGNVQESNWTKCSALKHPYCCFCLGVIGDLEAVPLDLMNEVIFTGRSERATLTNSRSSSWGWDPFIQAKGKLCRCGLLPHRLSNLQGIRKYHVTGGRCLQCNPKSPGHSVSRQKLKTRDLVLALPPIPYGRVGKSPGSFIFPWMRELYC